jgi:hypothetical protein
MPKDKYKKLREYNEEARKRQAKENKRKGKKVKVPVTPAPKTTFMKEAGRTMIGGGLRTAYQLAKGTATAAVRKLKKKKDK